MTGDGNLAEVHDVGINAYIYLYPLVTMDATRRQATNIEPGKRPGIGPVNTFSHIRHFPPADFKTVVRPNFDTLYSSAWLDLTAARWSSRPGPTPTAGITNYPCTTCGRTRSPCPGSGRPEPRLATGP
jgi:hypothetical protein